MSSVIRQRGYFPEWGTFTGPDMRIEVGEENGACNYLFAQNNPLVYVDPTGLITESQFQKLAKAEYHSRHVIDTKYGSRARRGSPTRAEFSQAFRSEVLLDGHSIYADDFSGVTLSTGHQRESVLFILGGNSDDPTLFARGSASEIAKYREEGYDVNIIDVDEATDYFLVEDGKPTPPDRNVGQVIRNAFGAIRNFGELKIYGHAGADVNLTSQGSELTANPTAAGHSQYGDYGILISDLKVSHPAKTGGRIDAYVCMGGGGVATWPQSLADTLGWSLRTVSPGFSCYFPWTDGIPKSKVRGTRPAARPFPFIYPDQWSYFHPGQTGPVPAPTPSSDFE